MSLDYDAFLVAREKVIEKVSIVDYYQDFIDEDIHLDRYNRDRCPLHDESTPSFFYFEDTSMFHCFGCGKTGSVVELHYHIQQKELDSYTKVKAILDLAKEYQVDIPNMFKSVGLDEVKQFRDNGKIKIKKKEEMRVPNKKLEQDYEKRIAGLRGQVPDKVLASLFAEYDKVFFVGVEIGEELKRIDKRIRDVVEFHRNKG